MNEPAQSAQVPKKGMAAAREECCGPGHSGPQSPRFSQIFDGSDPGAHIPGMVMDNLPLWALATVAIFVGSLMAAKWLDTIISERRK